MLSTTQRDNAEKNVPLLVKYAMALVRSLKFVGILATGSLVADVAYVQFSEETGLEAGTIKDLFDLIPGDIWPSVVRIAALSFTTLGATATTLELFFPRALRRVVAARRPAGSLVATTTSAI